MSQNLNSVFLNIRQGKVVRQLMQISDAHGPPVHVKHELCLECLQIFSRLTYQWKSSDFDATGDERLENGGGVDILYPHICIVSAYRIAPQPPSAGPLGFVPGFFTRGCFFIQALVSSRRQLVWMKSSGNPLPTIQPPASQVRVTSLQLFDLIQLKVNHSVLWVEPTNHATVSYLRWRMPQFLYCLTA